MRIVWSRRAVLEYEVIIQYLIREWSETAGQKFNQEIDAHLERINRDPSSFPLYAGSQDIRCVTVNKHTQIYYQHDQDFIQIITIWSTRRNPDWINVEGA